MIEVPAAHWILAAQKGAPHAAINAVIDADFVLRDHIGWLRSVRPTFGRIPDPALWVFDTIGLAVFIGCVGISAGPSFVSGLRTTGPSLLVVGVLVAMTPHLAAVLFGRYVLKMNPVILLGACAGAGTATAALRAVQDESGSKLPVLGYTVPYAIGNILLTACGPVIVMLTR